MMPMILYSMNRKRVLVFVLFFTLIGIGIIFILSLNHRYNHYVGKDKKWKEIQNTRQESTSISLEKLEFTILWIGQSEDFNENSIVLKLNYLNTCYLFMGDATGDVERKLLDEDISCNVLKVAHHGSKYSSIATFLSKVHPEYAIISLGEDNEYGHPHQVVLDKLETINSTIYRTDINHTILLKSDGDSIKIEFIDQSFNGGDLGQ